MTFTLQQIADHIGGRLHGDPTLEIGGADTIRDAASVDITFADRPELARELAESAAAAAIVNDRVTPVGKPHIVVADVRQGFAAVVHLFRPARSTGRIGIDPEAYISRSAKIAAGVDVHPQAYVGDDVTIGTGSVVHSGVRIMPGCRIGQHTVLFPNVVLYENTVIGDRCLVHACAVIGAYGFGYETVAGKHVLGAQLGNVVLEDDVDIGAGCTIDRGSYGSTVIGSGSKLDDQVQVGHNCKLGRHNILCSQVGIAGSCTTGDYVVMAGQVGVVQHLHIGDHAVIGGKAGVKDDVPEKMRMLGAPAVSEREFATLLIGQAKLPEMRKQIKQLMKQVAELEAAFEQRGRSSAA